MIDRGEHSGDRTVAIDTVNGPVFVAPAFLQVAARCGARVAFTEVHVEGWRVAARIVVASSDTAEGLTREFGEFVRAHIAARFGASGCTGCDAGPARGSGAVRFRLVAAAALLHVMIVVLVFAAGRMQLAPRFLDGDGIVPGSDSITYQRDARQLAVTLRQAGFTAWRRTAAPVHVRLLSLVLALFPALSGYGILAAEPLNLVCYLAIVVFTFAIGRETGSARSGLVAAGMIALWPTFVLTPRNSSKIRYSSPVPWRLSSSWSRG